MNQIQIERIAAALHALRPDWPIASLAKFVQDRANQPMTDLLVQLVLVAVDPETKTPARIDQDGPWKRALQIAPQERTAPQVPRARPDDCGVCSRPPSACAFDDSHEYEQVGRPKPRATTEQRERLKTEIADRAHEMKTAKHSPTEATKTPHAPNMGDSDGNGSERDDQNDTPRSSNG